MAHVWRSRTLRWSSAEETLRGRVVEHHHVYLVARRWLESSQEDGQQVVTDEHVVGLSPTSSRETISQDNLGNVEVQDLHLRTGHSTDRAILIALTTRPQRVVDDHVFALEKRPLDLELLPRTNFLGDVVRQWRTAKTATVSLAVDREPHPARILENGRPPRLSRPSETAQQEQTRTLDLARHLHLHASRNIT